MAKWTKVQEQRLQELNASKGQIDREFNGETERNQSYQLLEKELSSHAKAELKEYQEKAGQPALMEIGEIIAGLLKANGFAQVTTPILLSKGLLAKMTIDEDHALFNQVFWIDQKKCLRPMLAPNLYFLNKDLLRIWEHPVKIFEIGPCFRKDSQGGEHMQEFTMLNLVEMGLKEEECKGRLVELAEIVMQAAGISEYVYEVESSEVYGSTTDLVVNGLEVGSGAIGPHVLDRNWGITVPWVGIGLGLERLVMTVKGYNTVQRTGRSLTYLNGVRLNI